MPDFRFLSEPSPREIRHVTDLYRSAGWWQKPEDDPELVKQIIGGSHLFLVVKESDRIIGMGRVLSDKASDAYIQDLIIEQAYRGRRIGTKMMTLLIETLQSEGLEWIGVIAENCTAAFYRRFGFSPMKHATPMVLRSK